MHRFLVRAPIARQSVDRLAVSKRKLLTLEKGMSQRDVAQILGKRPGTIKSLVHRGLAKLSQIMSGPGATV